jgi:hypothetical protein
VSRWQADRWRCPAGRLTAGGVPHVNRNKKTIRKTSVQNRQKNDSTKKQKNKTKRKPIEKTKPKKALFSRLIGIVGG